MIFTVSTLHFFFFFLKKKHDGKHLREQTRLLLQITRILMHADGVLWEIASKLSGVRDCGNLGCVVM